MRILVTPTDSLGDLVNYLRRCACSAEIVGSNVVEASPLPGTAVNAAHERMELDAYLRVWQVLNEGVGAKLLGPTMPAESAAAARQSDVAAEVES